MSIENPISEMPEQQEEVLAWTQEAINGLQKAFEEEKVKSQDYWDRLL